MVKLTKTQKKILKNFNWLFSAYIYRFLIGFLTLAYVTRYLGPEKYGIYSYALSAFSFIDLFLSLVNQEVLKKEVIETENELSTLKTVICFQTGVSIVLVAVSQLFLWQFNLEEGDRRVVIAILSFSLLFRSIDVLSFYFSSQMRNDLIGRAEVGVVTSFNILRGILVFIKSHLYAFGWAMVFQKLINFLFIGFYYLRNYKKRFFSAPFDIKILKKVLRLSLPLFLATTATVIFTRIDQLMLGNLLDDKSVGIYSVVVKLSEPWIFIAGIFTQSIFPNLVESFSKSKSEFNVKIHKILSILLYISVGIIIGTYLFADIVVELIFSDQYAEAIPLLRVHIFYMIFIYWTHLTNQYDVIVGATKITLVKTVVASVMNVALNFILIRKLGVIGASYATIISYGFSAFLLNAFFKKTRPLFIMQLKSMAFWKLKWIY